MHLTLNFKNGYEGNLPYVIELFSHLSYLESCCPLITQFDRIIIEYSNDCFYDLNISDTDYSFLISYGLLKNYSPYELRNILIEAYFITGLNKKAGCLGDCKEKDIICEKCRCDQSCCENCPSNLKTDYYICKYDENGYDVYGYDENGYDEFGYDENGYDENDYDEFGYDENGYDENGYDENGYDENGYDENGYDENGYEDGYEEDDYEEDDDDYEEDDDDYEEEDQGCTYYGDSENRLKYIVKELGLENRTIEILDSNNIRAYTNGKKTVISRGALNTFSDDEIAFILSHEEEHITCDHINSRLKYYEETDTIMRNIFKQKNMGFFKKTFKVAGTGLLRFCGGTVLDYCQEVEADLGGQKRATKAGFSKTSGERVMKRFDKMSSGFSFTHPSPRVRERLLEKLDKNR